MAVPDYDPSLLIPCTSSNLAGFYWLQDPDSLIGSGTLFVAFLSGSVYRYAPCPEDAYDALFTADVGGSFGKTLNARVKAARVPYQRVQ